MGLFTVLGLSGLFMLAFGLFFKFIQVQGRKKHENSDS